MKERKRKEMGERRSGNRGEGERKRREESQTAFLHKIIKLYAVNSMAHSETLKLTGNVEFTRSVVTV